MGRRVVHLDGRFRQRVAPIMIAHVNLLDGPIPLDLGPILPIQPWQGIFTSPTPTQDPRNLQAGLTKLRD